MNDETIDRRAPPTPPAVYYRPQFTLGTILTIVAACVTGFVYITDLDKNHEVLVTEVRALEKQMDFQNETVNDDIDEIKVDVRKILDRLNVGR